jgi:hypothetical protein
MSAFLTPEGKSSCEYGWLNCVHIGKIALTPVVLWACAGFYAIQILRLDAKQHPWFALGVLHGAIVSAISFVWGVVIHGASWSDLGSWLLVPLYVAVWYTLLAVYCLRKAKPCWLQHVASWVGVFPFWVGMVYWSKGHYASLPEHPPGCFVVTAASKGHPWFVGTFLEIERRGVQRAVNQQLVTFWQLEQLWSKKGPGSHRSFRRVYNWIGPRIACCIRHRAVADVVYLVLKPVEWFALLLLRVGRVERKI